MWFQFFVLVFSFVMMYLLRPKISMPSPTAAKKLDIPKAEEGEEAGVVYGTVWITDPQVVWYGDMTSAAIKEKAGK